MGLLSTNGEYTMKLGEILDDLPEFNREMETAAAIVIMMTADGKYSVSYYNISESDVYDKVLPEVIRAQTEQKEILVSAN